MQHLDLDDFLRKIWLECCGHLSAFTIYGKQYSLSPDREFGDKSMNKKLEDILEPRLKFDYIYDFGSSTELILKVLDDVAVGSKKQKIIQLCRNEAPEIKCELCRKEATKVCCQCIWEDTGWVCDNCGEEHECGEDMLLPVVNSPRVGICGYTGGL